MGSLRKNAFREQFFINVSTAIFSESNYVFLSIKSKIALKISNIVFDCINPEFTLSVP